MATPPNTIRSQYPLPVYNYRVTIDTETCGFSKVSGLTIEQETIEYRHGMSFLFGSTTVAGRHRPVRLTLERGMIPGDRASFLYDWMRSLAYGRPDFHDIRIELLDPDGKAVFAWKARRAVARKLHAPEFDPRANSVAIERLEVEAKRLHFENLSGGQS